MRNRRIPKRLISAAGFLLIVVSIMLALYGPPQDWTDDVVYLNIQNRSHYALTNGTVCFLVGSTPRCVFDIVKSKATFRTRFVHHVSSDIYMLFCKNQDTIQTPLLGYTSHIPLRVRVTVWDDSLETSYRWR